MLRELLRALPNVVSLSRLALAVAFVAADEPLTRALLVVAAAASDALDGWIARAAGVTSRAGAFIDPLADRTFAILAVSSLLFDGVLSTVQYFILLSRDIMTMVGFVVARIMPTLREVPFQARQAGKVVTVLQFFALFVALARPTWAATFVYLTGVASAVSVADYTMGLVRARRAVLAAKGGPPSGPSGGPPSGPPTAVALLLALVPWFVSPAALWGQARPEWRLAAASPQGAELGFGVSVPAGPYLRMVPLVAAGGAQGTSGSEWQPAARAEVTARFSPDPTGWATWAPYGVGGLHVRCIANQRCTPALVARLGLEGPLWHGRWRPAFEAGLGGGAHVAVALRRGVFGRR
jgi:cardiolipin synthase (CMP-forming)